MNVQKTVLIPGGAGFIGANLIRKLLEENHKVIVWDNFYTGQESNLTEIISNGNFKLENHDIREYKEIECDVIINLACPASPPHYQKDPIYTWETSALGVLNLLKLAKKNNAIFIHASTSEVYGDPLEHPQKETYWGNVNPIGIRSCYDEGKRAAETLATDYMRTYGTDVRLIRIFNTYGPFMLPDDGRVVSNFIVQALQNKPLTIYGDGAQTRSFCFVSDLVEGFYAMMNLKTSPGVPINLGNPDEFTISELTTLVGETIQKEIKLDYKELPADDPTRRCPDISQAQSILQWTPGVKLKDGLALTVEYFSNVLAKRQV
ncbi:MAG: UDP-glucuronic acid decarboxylase family protein [Leptospirales bacterium]